MSEVIVASFACLGFAFGLAIFIYLKWQVIPWALDAEKRLKKLEDFEP